jgi:molybdenum cofactor cytidylyltransferase
VLIFKWASSALGANNLKLFQALSIHPKDVVALVGGGGKTSAMFRLGDELAALGWRVVLTTSTHIGAEQVAQVHHAITLPTQSPFAPRRQLLTHSPTLLVGPVDPLTQKAAGLSPGLIDDIANTPGVDTVINEADGARTLPFKAPAGHEPVLPSSTTLVVPVVGIDAVGQPLDAAHVHRPERVAALTGAMPGQPITAEHIAAVLSHAQGGLKDVPSHARVRVLVNKVESAAQAETAHRLARLLLQTPRIDAVAFGAVQRDDPVRALQSRVAVVVLAAGESRRFGRLKQLQPWGDGEGTLLSHAVDVALASQAHQVVVVLGYKAEECRAVLGDRILSSSKGRPAMIATNPNWAAGQSTSVRAGLASLPQNVGAVIFHLADQPGVTPAVIDTLIERHATTLAPVVCPEYDERRGNPILFDRATFYELNQITGDVGGKPVLQAYERAGKVERVAVDAPGVLLDIDSPVDIPKA